MLSPRYFYPPGLIAALARDLLFLRKRDFHRDAKACVARLTPPLKIIGPENIPQCGSCVITVNHYHSAGFKAQWLTLAIASVIPIHMHWIITDEITYAGKWYQKWGSMGSRILLKRIASIYGFRTMPPMPPRENDVQARVASVRAVLEYVRSARNPIVGLAPEGYDPLEGVLTRTAPGVGRFGLLLSQAGMKFVPVGAFEEERRFQLNFGELYESNVPRNLSPKEKDDQASAIIIKNIARLLPVHLRGRFA